jgi:hypothetical protein
MESENNNTNKTNTQRPNRQQQRAKNVSMTKKLAEVESNLGKHVNRGVENLICSIPILFQTGGSNTNAKKRKSHPLCIQLIFTTFNV